MRGVEKLRLELSYIEGKTPLSVTGYDLFEELLVLVSEKLLGLLSLVGSETPSQELLVVIERREIVAIDGEVERASVLLGAEHGWLVVGL